MCFTSLFQCAALRFWSCELRWYSTDCVLLSCFKAWPDILQLLTALRWVLFCSGLLTWSADKLMFITVTHCTTASKESACRKICMLCQQNSSQRWFPNVYMTSYCDVTNNIYAVTMTTVHHCSILDFDRGHTIKQSNRASPDLCTSLYAVY